MPANAGKMPALPFGSTHRPQSNLRSFPGSPRLLPGNAAIPEAPASCFPTLLAPAGEKNFITRNLPSVSIREIRGKMKIAILAAFPLHALPEFGEAYRPSYHYATWLPQLAEAYAGFPDLDVHWIVLSAQVAAAREVSWNNQTFHVLPTARRLRAATLFHRDRKTIRARIAAIGPKLVHGWGTEDVYALAAVTSGVANIVSMQGILSHYILKNRMSGRDYLQALLELFVLRTAGCITVESEWGREIVLRRNPSARVSVVEYGVQNHFLDIEWRPDPAKPAAIFIGSIDPRKGVQDAVEAFRNPALSGAELWVAGSGESPWVRELIESAPPNVRWLGRLPSQQVAGLLARAWCLVLPTRADTSPNVVKEARVIGLPVISTPCGGQTAYVQHGENGFLIAPGDVAGLTESLRALLTELPQCRAMGEHRHEEHRHILDPRRTAENFHALYRSFLPLG